MSISTGERLPDAQFVKMGSDGPETVELAELTQIALIQVELYVSWGEPPRDRSRRFSTVKARMAGSLENLE